MARTVIGLLLLAGALFSGCTGKNTETQPAFKCMEQIHQEEGVPVRVRSLSKEPFSVYLNYPAVLRARAESTASANLDDVVRAINYRIGDLVKKDEVVLSFSKDNNGYRQARVSFENAESNFKRSQSLFESKGISQQAFDNAKAGYEMAGSSFKAADDMINVKAPISGHITSLRVQVTGNVKAGDPLFTVSNLDLIEGQVWVSSSEIGRIQTEHKAIVEWMGKEITGRVSRVNQIMDTEKKAFLVLVEFRNPDRLLTSGITADIQIETYHRAGVIIVGRNELVREGDAYFAFVTNNGFAEKRKLVLGAQQGFFFEIVSGLDEGENLITEGKTLVTDGAKVKIVPPENAAKPKS